jgi:hypothetical protein
MSETKKEKIYKVKRDDEDIAHLEAWANKASFEDMQTHYPTMLYEDGVRQTLDWLFGKSEDSPADD